MKVYKKLFQYVSDVMLSGYMAILVSSISAFLMVYGYYFIYKFLEELIVSANYESASFYSTRIVMYLTISALLYIASGMVSHKMAFCLETNLRNRNPKQNLSKSIAITAIWKTYVRFWLYFLYFL